MRLFQSGKVAGTGRLHAEEIDGLIQSYIKEDVLYRQAVAMGLNEDDPITRRRMAQKLEFLTSDLAMMVQPAEGELEQYFRENSEVYRAPDRMTFSQVFFDPDSRGNKTLEDAAKALLKLQAAGVPTEESMQVGDGFMLQSDFVSVTEAGSCPSNGQWLCRGRGATGTRRMAWSGAVRLRCAPGLCIQL